MPLHTVTGTIEIGHTILLGVANSVPFAPAIVIVGTGASVPLASIGMGTCTLLASLDATATITLLGTGSGSLPIAVPPAPALIGGVANSQIAVLDVGAATPTKIVMTRGMAIRFGGDL